MSPRTCQSLLARLAHHATSRPTRAAYIDVTTGATTDYATLHSAVLRQATRIAARRPTTLVLHCGNRIEFVVWCLAALKSGCGVLALHESATVVERSDLARRVGAEIIVSDAEDATVETWHVSMAMERSVHGPRLDSAGEGTLLLTSSGSTGAPKIVRRSMPSLDAVAANIAEAIGISANDRILATVPLAHSYGIEHGLLAPIYAGATTLLCDGLRLPELANAVASGVSVFPAVPSVLERLADASQVFEGLSRVRAIYSAGAPLPEAVRERYLARYGTPIGQLYGSTEIGTVTYRSGDDGSGVGWPMHGVSIRTLDSGEVAIASPSMLLDYVGEPAPLVDGHFLTGDLGHIAPDGCLVLTGRAKLLIDTGGAKVNPLEVEAVLQQHPQVAACVIVASRQSATVARLHAIVVPRDPSDPPTIAALRAFAREKLAPHKVPRAFEIRESLPRSATGKVLRSMLSPRE